MKKHIRIISLAAIVSAAALFSCTTAETPQVMARYVPERMDDFVFENNLICGRIYGKALEGNPTSPGIDIWVKLPGKLVADEWYRHYSEDGNESYYHHDHGGKDCYKVASSLGGGASAPVLDGNPVLPPTNYRSWEILEDSPSKVIFRLDYPEWETDGQKFALSKTITVTPDTYFFKVEDVWTFSGKYGDRMEVAAGINRHTALGTIEKEQFGKDWYALWEHASDTSHEAEDGMLGVAVQMSGAQSVRLSADGNHAMVTKTVTSGEPLVYYFGNCWSKGAIKTSDEWFTTVESQSCAEEPAYEFEELYSSLPFPMNKVQRPCIPSRTVSVVDFGAKGDGSTLNTEAFAKAIKAVSSKGGGHVIVPAGLWLTGPVELRSAVDLHLEKGAVLLFSDDPSLYKVIDTNFEGLDTRRCISPLYAAGCHDISITGNGIVEGNGDGWRMLKKSKVSAAEWKAHQEKYPNGIVSDEGKEWYPDEAFKQIMERKDRDQNTLSGAIDEKAARRWLRPVMVQFENCEKVLLEGCTFQNSPCWNIHPLFCRNVIIKDITVRAPYWSQNGDGIDIDACENAILTNSTFDVGDDAICIKSGKNEDGRRHATACRNLIISGCTVYHGHGGFVVGSEMSGGVNNIMVTGCTFLGTDVGFRFKSTRGRGGVVENIWLQNTVMKDILAAAISFNLFYEGKAETDVTLPGSAPATVPVDETTPVFRNIRISDVLCNGAGEAMLFRGLPEMPISGVELRNIDITATKGATFLNCPEPLMENVDIRIN